MKPPPDHDRTTGRTCGHLPLLAVAALLPALGCGDRDAVRSYDVPKEQSPQTAVPANPSPGGAEPGPPAAVAAPDVMQWELPPGWAVADNPNTMRFATLAAGTGEDRVEVAITRLGGAAGGVANNVNRWRGQIGLPAQSEAEITQGAASVGTDGVWVDLMGPDPHGGEEAGLRMFAAIFPGDVDTWFLKAVGPAELLEQYRDGFVELCESVTFGAAGDAAQTPPTAPPTTPQAAPSTAPSNGQPAAPPATPPAAVSESGAGSAPGLSWANLPAGWTLDASPRPMSIASFTVTDGAQDASVTITPLGGRQDLLANVNRWRGQVGLGPLGGLDDDPPSPIDMSGAPAQLVDAAGTGGHILAVMSERNGTTWFVKMSGPDPLVAGAREGFEAFVRSMRFDGDGE